MKELKVGSVVAFVRDNETKTGTVHKLYEDMATALVKVPGEEEYYKVLFSDLNVISEPNDQEPDEIFITITPTEFTSISTELIKLLPDPDLQMILKLFSNMLSREMFGQLPQND